MVRHSGNIGAEAAGEKWLLGVHETAQLLGISRETVFRLLASGELRRTRVRGRTLIPRADVAAYVERQTTSVP